MGKKSQSKTLPGKLEKMQQVLLENHFAATCQTKAVHAIKQKWRPTTRTKIIIFYWIYFKWNSQRWSVCEPEDQSYFSQVQVIDTGSKVKINNYRNKQTVRKITLEHRCKTYHWAVIRGSSKPVTVKCVLQYYDHQVKRYILLLKIIDP